MGGKIQPPDPPGWVWTVGYIIGLAFMAGLGAAILFVLGNQIGML